jgi:hypothetical protein
VTTMASASNINITSVNAPIMCLISWSHAMARFSPMQAKPARTTYQM